jgi:hypothetical protein
VEDVADVPRRSPSFNSGDEASAAGRDAQGRAAERFGGERRSFNGDAKGFARRGITYLRDGAK